MGGCWRDLAAVAHWSMTLRIGEIEPTSNRKMIIHGHLRKWLRKSRRSGVCSLTYRKLGERQKPC